MDLDTVRHFMNAEPFVPIELRLANGDRHQVQHPDFIAVGRDVVMVGYPDSSRIAWSTPHQIVSIEKIVAPAEAGRNGS